MMRPKSTKADLPSSYDIKNHLHEQFIARLKELKGSIAVSGIERQWPVLN
jgi:hypothetical protein